MMRSLWRSRNEERFEIAVRLKENTPEETSGVFSGWLSGFGVGLSLTNIDYENTAKLHMDNDVIATVELCSVLKIACVKRLQGLPCDIVSLARFKFFL